MLMCWFIVLHAFRLSFLTPCLCTPPLLPSLPPSPPQVGMMVMGVLGDFLGRKWGSRVAAAIMLSGVIMLCFTPYAPTAAGYFAYFITAQTWYGIGVGAEYPMASGSAAELAEVHPELKDYRGRQVVLVFANQGLGNMFNTLIVLVCMYSFGMAGNKPNKFAPANRCAYFNTDTCIPYGVDPTTGKAWAGTTSALVSLECGGNTKQWLIPTVSNKYCLIEGDAAYYETLQIGSKQALSLMYGVGALFCITMCYYRFFYLNESKLFAEEQKKALAAKDARLRRGSVLATGSEACCNDPNTGKSIALYWPRQFVASMAWFANDFAFYGNKLQQGVFIALLYPTYNPFQQMCWSAVNSFVALCGYYVAAALIDKTWYGRKIMQNVGFFFMFIFYITIWAQWESINNKVPANVVAASGIPETAPGEWFQAMYYLSSFFNQFGPNATTWLVAGEIFPTAVRTTNHGIAATVGKLGAIISTIWIIAITNQKHVFLVSAMWAIGGMAVTWFMLPETTGLDLKELDDMHRAFMSDTPESYTGEAINPKHLSPFEMFFFGWHRNYKRDPTLVYKNPCAQETEEPCCKEVRHCAPTSLCFSCSVLYCFVLHPYLSLNRYIASLSCYL